ncbi:Pentatricopeptide repeat-containing protein [Acorus calamus]|uniref:Pentatricopeptide repeat-containing protein n=1 Tax=Acorus calamus TaxID=4465 RepID=A0AAV9FEW1_ACOCL|nr:Pentatricopeptide repeat-containing protein [Acorus calamus]
MPERNVVSWNAMVSAYAKNGRLEEARAVFDAMPERDVASWNAMLTGYCHASLMEDARELFEGMGERDIASWTVLMSGYVRIEDYAKAWEAFRRMRSDDGLLCPDRPSFVAVVSALTGLGDVKLLENLRTLAIKTGCEADVVMGTATLNAYTRMGELDSAVAFFEAMPEKNGFAWSTVISALARFGRLDEAIELFDRDPDKTVESRTSMLAGYAQNGRVREARSLFDGMPVPGIVSWNAMIAGYAQNGMMGDAMGLFERMPRRNNVSWAVMIAGCAQNGRPGEALRLLSELHRLGAVPSHSCFTSAIFACANMGAREMGRQTHALAIKAGAAKNNPYIANSLITMYTNCGDGEEARRVFGQMRSRDTVSWNALIAGLSLHSMVEEARVAFERMPRRDIVSWTSIISAYARTGTGFEAFELFQRMLRSGVEPNAPAIMSILSFCSNFGATKLGLQVHSLVFRLGLDSEVFVGNALVGMYFRCGCVDSFKVFDEMDERDIVTWNSMLSGCAHNGLGREAIDYLYFDPV